MKYKILVGIALLIFLFNSAMAQTPYVKLASGNLNNYTVQNGILEFDMQPDMAITGQITIETNNTSPGGNVAPLVLVWNWGDHASSFVTINNWIGTGVKTYSTTINLQSPAASGVYYLVFAFGLEMNGAQIASLTNWQVPGNPHWNDGHDIADWRGYEYLQSVKEHLVKTIYEHAGGPGDATIPAAMIKINVGDYSTVKLLGGSLNDIGVQNGHLEFGVGTNGMLRGNIKIEAHNTAPANDIAPLVMVWSWGAHQNSFVTIKNHIGTGTSVYEIPIDLIAPPNEGDYYLTFAFAWELQGYQVASLTNWRVQGNPHWNDDHDIADWAVPEYGQFMVENRVTTMYEYAGGLGLTPVPAAMVHLIVRNLSTAKILSGNINNLAISPTKPNVPVPTGGKLAGTFRLETNNTGEAGNVAPLVFVWGWGDHKTGFHTMLNSVALGITTHDIGFDLVAPTTPGNYYLTTTFSYELNGAQVASLTNWRVSGNPHWDDGRDIADWGFKQYEQSDFEHRAQTPYEMESGVGMSILPAAMIQVRVLRQPAFVESIWDVPNDQGRWVRVSWQKSGIDGEPVLLPVLKYSVWRRIDPLPISQSTQKPDYAAYPKLNNLKMINEQLEAAAMPLPSGEWDYLVSVPAVGIENYHIIAPTLADSTIVSGVHWSAFTVMAHTEDPMETYIANIDSGYSIDNLIPHAPDNFKAILNEQEIQLTWEMIPDKDFNYYAIYRHTESGFDPENSEPLVTTTLPDYLDKDFISTNNYFYRIVAFDFSGNQGKFSEEASVYLVSTDNLQSITPKMYALLQNFPNPFNASTNITFQLPEKSQTFLGVYNLSGQLIEILVNEIKPAGEYTIKWHADKMSSGIYFYKLIAGDFSCTAKLILLR